MYIIDSCMGSYNDGRMATGKMLASLGRKKPAVGAKQLRKAIQSGSALQVFLARNADPAITEPLVALCERHSMQVYWVGSMKELGQACGIEVGASAAAVLAD